MLASFLLSFFVSVLLSCSFIWDTFFVSFWLIPCDSFYVLGRSGASLRLGMVALYSKSFIRPSVAFSLATWDGCSKDIPCVDCVCLSIVIEPQLLLAHHVAGHVPCCEKYLWLQWTSCCIRAYPREGESLYLCSGACWVHHLGVIYAANCVVLWCCLK